MEQRIGIKSGHILLEGLLDEAGGDRGAVICHPHPLYGGDMNNNVVSTLAAAYRKAGYATLRFNFRGVGRSGGSYDQGRGEQEDLLAAVFELVDRAAAGVDVAGYSFGAWIGALAADRLEHADSLVFVSPPVDFIDFSFLAACPKLRLVITGEKDDLATPERVRRLAGQWNPDAGFHVIPGADHFYLGHTGELKRIMEECLRSRAAVRDGKARSEGGNT